MPKKILIVDDEKDFVEYVGKLVEKHGYISERVCGGREAIEKLDSEKYDLVLLDLMMPEVSGWDVLANIRNSTEERKKNTRVVIVSARSKDTDIFRGYKEGGDYYITKPFKAEHLINIVNYLIGDLSTEERERLEQRL